jgi:hypothetical protein
MKHCAVVTLALIISLSPLSTAAYAVSAEEKSHELCSVCHIETVQDFLTHPHFEKGIECDACHGESVRHRTSQGHAEPDRIAAPHEIPSLCGGCHAGKGTVPISKQYAESRHGQLLLSKAKQRAPHCGTCHGVHSVRSDKAIEGQCKRCHAQPPASCKSDARQAKQSVSCLSCHSAHIFSAKK